MQHYDFLTPLVSCTIMSRFAHIMHNPPGSHKKTLCPLVLGFKILGVFPICMKRFIVTIHNGKKLIFPSPF